MLRPARSTLFPYTTLFRSLGVDDAQPAAAEAEHRVELVQRLDPFGDHLRLHLQLPRDLRSEEHTSELQSHSDLVCRLLLEKKKKKQSTQPAEFKHNDGQPR